MNLYQDIFLRSPIPRLIIRVAGKASFVVEAINDAGCAFFHADPKKIIDKNLDDCFSSEIRDHMSQALKTCVRAKQNLTIQSVADLVDDPEVQAFAFNPLFNENNEVERIDVVARMNLPDNVQLRKERDDAISMLSSIFDTATVGIVVLDRHHRIVRVNDVFVKNFEWDRTELVGETFDKLTSENDYKLFSTTKPRSSETHKVHEIRIKKPNGSDVDVYVTTAFLELTSKRRFKIATILDISKQKEMEHSLRDAKEDAESANRAKSAFLANMSHELRTPLNAIIGFTELIKSGTFGLIENSKYDEYLTDILFSAQHLLDIINDVLDMSKIEAGKVDIHDRDVDIPDLFDSVKRIMHDRAAVAEIDLVTEIDPDLPDLFADRRWLRQMLMNLVSNSIKFSPKDSKIIMRAELLKNKKMRLSVIDHGEGIEADKIATVLEPFGQAKDAETNRGQGTGLGLPLAKAMAEMHNADFMLKSKINKGTTVTIDFPENRILSHDNSDPKKFDGLVDSPNHANCLESFKEK